MTQEQIDQFVYYLSDTDIALVQAYLDTKFKGPKPSREIYQAIKGQLTGKAAESEIMFGSSLTTNVREGFIVGVEARRRVGYSNVNRNEPKVRPAKGMRPAKGSAAPSQPPPRPPLAKVAEPKPEVVKKNVERLNKFPNKEEPVVLPQANPVMGSLSSPSAPAPKKEEFRHARYVWIGKKMFSVPRSNATIETMITTVMGGRPSADGEVVFSGRRWSCEHTDIFERFVTSFLFGLYKGDSEPVLDDGTGMSVELRISSGLIDIQKEEVS